MTVLLDTSFIIAFDNKKDVYHNKARELWEKIENLSYGQYFISDYVFDEVIAVSLRKTGKEGTISLGQKIVESIPIINVDDHIFEESWRIFKETTAGLSFTDCTNVAILKLIETSKLATFDKGFEQIKEIEILSS